jgi:hypothetical protein
MPHRRFALIFEGTRETIERAWTWLTKAAALAEAFRSRYPNWSEDDKLLMADLESVLLSYPKLINDIRERNVPDSFGENFDPGSGYSLSSNDLLLQHPNSLKEEWDKMYCEIWMECL